MTSEGTGESKVFEFRCADCGEVHRGSPSFGYEKPSIYFTVPADEVADRVRLSDDLCTIDDDTFLIRGLIEIPIHGVEEPFAWGVWVTQSRESFERYVETFDQDQSGDGSFGWLDVTMPGYVSGDKNEDRAMLACNVHWRGEGQRPLIVPQECDHPLYKDCVEGVSWERAMHLARLVMHG